MRRAHPNRRLPMTSVFLVVSVMGYAPCMAQATQITDGKNAEPE